MNRAPFLVVPWQDDFLEKLLEQALEDTGGDIGKAVFIFPHSRPQRYLVRLLRHDARVRRPLVLPRMHTISGLFTDCRVRIRPRPLWNAGLLDRVGALFECLGEECATLEEHEQTFPYAHDVRKFFPWGIRLASLFEECFNQRVLPQNFAYAEGQVGAFATLLLTRLRGMFDRYLTRLEENGWTSPGYDAFTTASWLTEGNPLPEGIIGAGPLYIAGFHALTGSEDLLLRHLWSGHGGRVVLHADPALVAGNTSAKQPHWSCSILQDWARRWGTSIDLAPAATTVAHTSPHMEYYQGFDLHSQLASMQTEVEKIPDLPLPEMVEENALPEDPAQDPRDEAGSALLLLPDSGLLMPVLHHLPRTDINISMGYALDRSPLFRLIDGILTAQERKRGATYYWRDLVALFRHPYLKMLRPLAPENNGEAMPDAPEPAPLRVELHRLEQALRRQGRAYVDPEDLLEEVYSLLAPEELPPREMLVLLDSLFKTVLSGFSELDSPFSAGMALAHLSELLLQNGAHLWRHFLIDAECLYRLRQSLIPELTESRLAREAFPSRALFAIVRSLMAEERVPFDASPLVGLQVMGMLETRLLSFKHVFIVDAVDGKLPGAPAADPLLPEALRAELGLPPLHTREQVSAYHFFRLIAGAERVSLFWQEGTDAPGIQEQRAMKSRFIEELLWDEEKRLGRLLEPSPQPAPDAASVRLIGSSVSSITKKPRGIRIGDEERRLLTRLMGKPVSASLLDAYLRCPVQFYYERAARLSTEEGVREGEDPLAVGNLLHHILHESYAPYRGKAVPGGDACSELLYEDLLAALQGHPEYAERAEALPADAFTTFTLAAKKRLKSYLTLQPPCTVLELEVPLSCSFSAGGKSYTLHGRADRVDLRRYVSSGREEQGIAILDYKTGEPSKILGSFWVNAHLWDRIHAWSAGSRDDAALLSQVYASIESVQLPLYLTLFARAAQEGTLQPELLPYKDVPLYEACWVALGNKGEERPLFTGDLDRERRGNYIESLFPALFDFLLRHITESTVYFPKQGAYCRWCSCVNLCKVAVQ